MFGYSIDEIIRNLNLSEDSKWVTITTSYSSEQYCRSYKRRQNKSGFRENVRQTDCVPQNGLLLLFLIDDRCGKN